jgi:hypothetical protein
MKRSQDAKLIIGHQARRVAQGGSRGGVAGEGEAQRLESLWPRVR